jgi:hypothetical protein
MVSAILPISGGTEKEIREEMPLARAYAHFHLSLTKLGHDVQWPAVISARRSLSATWMQDMIKTATETPMTGVCHLD